MQPFLYHLSLQQILRLIMLTSFVMHYSFFFVRLHHLLLIFVEKNRSLGTALSAVWLSILTGEYTLIFTMLAVVFFSKLASVGHLFTCTKFNLCLLSLCGLVTPRRGHGLSFFCLTVLIFPIWFLCSLFVVYHCFSFTPSCTFCFLLYLLHLSLSLSLSCVFCVLFYHYFFTYLL